MAQESHMAHRSLSCIFWLPDLIGTTVVGTLVLSSSLAGKLRPLLCDWNYFINNALWLALFYSRSQPQWYVDVIMLATILSTLLHGQMMVPEATEWQLVIVVDPKRPLVAHSLLYYTVLVKWENTSCWNPLALFVFYQFSYVKFLWLKSYKTCAWLYSCWLRCSWEYVIFFLI